MKTNRTVDWQIKYDRNGKQIGLAIRYDDGILGPVWLWGGSLDKYRCIPSARAFVFQNVEDSIYSGKIASYIYRLERAGILDISDRIMITRDLMFEVDIWKNDIERSQ
jgi:hypothetical protein